MSYYFFIESYFYNAANVVLQGMRTQDDAINLYNNLPLLHDKMVTLSIKVFGDYPIDDFLVFVYETINTFVLRRSWQYNKDIWYLNIAYSQAIYTLLIGMFEVALATNETQQMRNIFIAGYYKHMNELPEADETVRILRAYAKYWRTKIYED